MNSNELQPGDLIFSFSSIGEAEHLALYAGKKGGVPYVLHATTAPHDAVMLTYLTPPGENCHYRVMRPLNVPLALDAKEVLLTWVEHLVPYASVKKRDKILNWIDNLGGLDNPTRSGIIQQEYGKKTYQDNYSQYLLMANHLPFIPLTYTDENKIEGLRCAEALVAAFNIALLLQHATHRDDKWFIEDVASLEDFVDALDNPLPFDAKNALSFGVYQHCLDSPMHWDNQGELTYLSYPEPGPSDKTDWRDFKASLQAVARINTLRFIESPRAIPENSEMDQYLRFSPISPATTSITRSRSASLSVLRARSISTSSIDLNDDEGPIVRLLESPFYVSFFRKSSPIEPVELKPGNTPAQHI